ncbi:MAG: hypothetical protein AAGD25_28580 [Cyanobacteria bacterium P01_F01_bin.150]
MTANSLQRNLILDIDGHNVPVKVGRKQEVTRTLTLVNRSDRTIDVDLWIEPQDAQAAPLQQWCRFSTAMPRIESGDKQQITLTFEIPLQTASGFYSYDICAEPRAFPGEIARRSQQLELQPSEQEIALRNEPIFRLDPPTSSEHPYELTAGKLFEVKVKVENHSKLVDRFFLTCPELSPDWFDIKYPEINESQPGQRAYMDGLQLNPGKDGTITLTLKPPLLTAAGHYSTTLRLTSDNQNSLVLLDILYFIIQVSDGVTASLTPKMGHIPGDDSDFKVALHNQGNIHRNLTVTAKDGDHIFHYAITPNPIQLSPGKQEEVLLIPKRRKWWRRQWKKRQEIRFQVEIWDTPTDTADWEILPDNALFLPKPIEGKILWESYPAWLRWLLKGLLLALLLAGATVLAWYALKRFIVDPGLQPRVLALDTPKDNYVLKRQNPIQLDFEISNSYALKEERPEDNAEGSQYHHAEDTQPLHYLQFAFLERDVQKKFESNPNDIDRQWLKNQGCDETLRPFGPLFGFAHFLVYPSKPYTPHVLSCQALIIPSKELVKSNIQEKDNQPSSSTDTSTDTSTDNNSSGTQETVLRSGTYEVELKILKVREEKSNDNQQKKGNSKPFSWKSIYKKPAAFFKKLFSSNVQATTANSEASIADVSSTDSSDADNPCTTLVANVPSTKDQNQPSKTSCISQNSKQIKSIQLVAEPAEISYFYSKSATYRDQGVPIVVQRGNGETEDFPTAAADTEPMDTPPQSELIVLSSNSTRTQADATAQFPPAPIALNWVIDNLLDIEKIELSHIAAETNGNIQSSEPMSFVILEDPDRKSRVYRENQETNSLEWVSQCEIEGDRDRLICRDVPTNALKPGEYTFELKVLMLEESQHEAIAQETDPITIRSPYPEILSFKVNGQEVADHPQQVHMLNPAIGSVDVMVEWEVANPDQVNVELQPSPGLVTSKGAIPYSVLEGNTILTLQVGNEAGEIAKQSVTISAAAAPAPRPRAVVPISPRLPSIPVSPVPGVPFPAPPTTVQPSQPPNALPEPLQVPPSGN